MIPSPRGRAPDNLRLAFSQSGVYSMTQRLEPRFVGFDVHKREVTYCIIDAAGAMLEQRKFDLDAPALHRFAKRTLQPGDHAALESTTNCWAVAEILRGYVARVVVSNPMATKAIAQSKIKTDKVDSHVLAQLLRCDYLPEVWRPDPETRLRRQLSGRRASLVGQRTQMRNRIHSVFAMRLIVPPEGLFTDQGRKWLDGLTEETLDADALMMIRSDLRLLDALQGEIEAFDQRLAELAWRDERVKLLMTIPGVSVIVGQALVAAFGDITRFASADKAAAYLGLTPRTKQSAKNTYHGPITKCGNANARWMLVQAAQHFHRQQGPLGHFFRRLKRRKTHNVAVVATARKLAMIAWRMLVANEPYRYAPPRSTADKLAKLRVAVTGKKRASGTPKGVKAKAKLPGAAGGSRTIKSLDSIYESEGLPPRSPLPAGESRHVARTDTTDFVHNLGTDQVVPRKRTHAAAE
jgi:transposase